MVQKLDAINTSKIREDFPILKRQVNGKPLVYFDNAATSQKPTAVIEAIASYYKNYNANIHRGIHKLAEEATLAYEDAREKSAKFVNAGYPEEIIFVRNATEGINLVANSWGRTNVGKGDKIVITIMEHHSNIVPWQLLAQQTGAQIEFIEITDDGMLRQDQLERAIDNSTKIVAVTHASNVLGTINPVNTIGKLAHRHGALFLLDAAQSVPHMKVDVRDIDCDFMVFSGHKMMSPTGIGVLYGKREHLEGMPPFLGGGEMIKEVHTTNASWNDIPYKFEAGTPDIAGVIGLGAAIDYLNRLGIENIHVHEQQITGYALSKISTVEGVKVYGPKSPKDRVGVISFNLGDIHAHDLASILDEEGIAIRSGHHCAQPLMEFIGVPAMSRISFYAYNTEEEVDVFTEALGKAGRLFKL
ncbi:MAG TPA: cysteine desulfurase [Candidatus Saccharimonadales bacterium]|nr:cysteine desulfurase [Candidatus Saccharimonadales bacterium]